MSSTRDIGPKSSATARASDASSARITPAVARNLLAHASAGSASAGRALLSALGDAVAPLTGETEIVRVATRLVGEYLGVQRCGFFEADEARGEIVVAEGWRREGLATIAGRHPTPGLVRPEVWAAATRGPIVVDDVVTHPLTAGFVAAYARLHVRAFSVCACGKARPRVFALGVASDEPRAWTPEEVELLENVVARIWPLVQRARSDAALRESEARLRLALSAANLGDWSWNAVTDELTLSARAAEIFELAPDARTTWAEIRGRMHPDDVERARAAIEQAFVQRSDYDAEYRIRRANGEWTWVAAKGRGMGGPDGAVLGMIGVLQEITVRKRDEERLRAQDAELRVISANAPAVLSHWGRDERLRFASRAFAARFRTRPEDLVGKSIAEVLGEKAYALLRPYIERVLAGEPVQFEIDVPYDQLGLRHMRVSYAPDFAEDRSVRGFFSAVTDMTDRHRTELALRESEERLRLATRTGKIGLWDWDIASNRVTWTDSVYEIHGVDPDTFELSLDSFTALIHPEDRAPVQRAIQSSLEHGAPYELEFRAVRPGGGVIWLFTTASVTHEDGRPRRLTGATLDITARKMAELALRESEERFRALASHAPVGIFLTDASGGCLFVNETWRELSGLSPEQARGRGWMKALHADDRARVAAEWQAAMAERRPFAAEYRFQRPDGSVSWLQGGALEIRKAGGALSGHIGTIVDITQRKTAEEALRGSERRFRTLASHAPVGIFLTDAHGDTILVNDAWCTMAGLSAAQAQGRAWSDAVHAEDRARVLEAWNEAVRTGTPTVAEYRFLHADGAVTWVQGNAVPLRDAAGAASGFIGTIADITERKAAEEKLRAQEAQLRLISTNAPIMLAHCDREDRFLFVNRAYASRFDLDPEQFVGRTISDVLGAEARAVIAPYIRRVLGGEKLDFEIEVPYRGLGPRCMRVAYVPDIAADGTIRGWLSASSDVTEQQRDAARLREAQAQLEAHAEDLEQRVHERTASLREAIVQMEEFSYSVSHDLRAPLRAMQGYSQALLEDYGSQLDATAQSYLERIQRSSARMEKLTHDILSYSRVARTDLELKPVQLESVLADLIGQYAELQAPAARLEIVGPLPAVRGHESSLWQCLANLMMNAAKFVAPGVTPHIRVRATVTGDRVRLWIEDNGIGIEPQHQKRLFHVFERVPTQAAYDGTGIGLAIVRKAVEKMDGRCGVESTGRDGSRFWLELPKA
ncbi:MAG TPA: PAS domain S-box protein [Opitutaceae bacterium]|nr:PAS domain S-box protein [Opitutaceae bacterium]